MSSQQGRAAQSEHPTRAYDSIIIIKLLWKLPQEEIVMKASLRRKCYESFPKKN